MKYCPLCRSTLTEGPVDGAVRLRCASPPCGFVHWNNPVPVVAGLVRRDGRYLLARNTAWPLGVFSMITGFLEQGESPEAAILRETQEELGLQARRCRFIGHFPLPKFNQLLIAYAVDAEGVPKLAAAEIAEVREVSREELAAFDFGSFQLTRDIVDGYLQQAPAEGFT